MEPPYYDISINPVTTIFVYFFLIFVGPGRFSIFDYFLCNDSEILEEFYKKLLWYLLIYLTFLADNLFSRKVSSIVV